MCVNSSVERVGRGINVKRIECRGAADSVQCAVAGAHAHILTNLPAIQFGERPLQRTGGARTEEKEGEEKEGEGEEEGE